MEIQRGSEWRGESPGRGRVPRGPGPRGPEPKGTSGAQAPKGLGPKGPAATNLQEKNRILSY